MKTIKFLTILFTLLLGTAITASAQGTGSTDDGTINVTPVAGKTNQWTLTMPGSDVVVTAVPAEAYAVLTKNGTDDEEHDTYTLTF